MATAHAHTHTPDGDQVALWFKALDLIVWAAVVVIVVLALEWLGGYLVRERISRGASAYLARLDELRGQQTE